MNKLLIEETKNFLIDNADSIQKKATALHKKYLGTKIIRTDYLEKYQKSHRDVVIKLAENLASEDPKESAEMFQELGEKIAKMSSKDGLTLEEAIDGTIFLRQAIYTTFKTSGYLKKLSVEDFYELGLTVGVYVDTLASKIAFVYHHERLTIENNLTFLAEASRILSSSLDYQTTLNTVTSLAVPQIGDWCVVDLLDNGEIHQVAIAHKDPKKIKWAKKLREVNPVDPNATTGIANVLRTGKPEIYTVISDEMLIAASKSKEHLKLLREIGFRSAIIVPIFSSKKTVGTIMFVTTESSRNYNEADLTMAQELAYRASVAIENARLFKGSQEAITIRDEFISVASHELKTPVTSVKMFTQVLKKHSEQIGDKKAVTYLSKMDKQINSLTELIYDLLNVSKIQAGKMDFKNTPFNFDDSIREIIDVLQQSVERHKIILEGETGKVIYGDEERIGQVINNLISNAEKYSPRADKIIVKLSSTNENVKVEVEDFGIGMEDSQLNRIFERFYRVYDTTDKTFPGLGIGLYICSEIIKRHGGEFHVESNIGKGSIFSFTLPVKKGENG